MHPSGTCCNCVSPRLQLILRNTWQLLSLPQPRIVAFLLIFYLNPKETITRAPGKKMAPIPSPWEKKALVGMTSEFSRAVFPGITARGRSTLTWHVNLRTLIVSGLHRVILFLVIFHSGFHTFEPTWAMMQLPSFSSPSNACLNSPRTCFPLPRGGSVKATSRYVTKAGRGEQYEVGLLLTLTLG